MPELLVALDHVWRSFREGGRDVSVVEDLTIQISAGEAFCLVGESGCGKTTAGKIMAGLLRPTRGRVLFRGQDIAGLAGAARRRFRLGVQLVHQDPFASLNPTHRVDQILATPLRRHRLVDTNAAIQDRMIELLETVGLTPAADLLVKFPHQLSGGQRQRVAIARALTVNPSFIVADEAVSMVDVSIRVSILDTLRQLRTDRGLSVLLITHDLALARYFAADDGRIGVMYLGRLVELGNAAKLVADPEHPYTKALVAASPADPRGPGARRPAIPIRSAEVPSITARPAGCPFHPRCPIAEPGLCDSVNPDLEPLATGTWAACHPVQRHRGLNAVPARTPPHATAKVEAPM